MALYDIQTPLQYLYKAALTVCKNVYVTNRPSSVSTSMSEFVVVSLPVTMRTHTYGYEAYATKTTGRMMLFTKDKSNNVPDVATMQSTLDKLLALFPLSGTLNELRIQGVRPTVIYTGSDDNGFHTVTIQFELLIT